MRFCLASSSPHSYLFCSRIYIHPCITTTALLLRTLPTSIRFPYNVLLLQYLHVYDILLRLCTAYDIVRMYYSCSSHTLSRPRSASWCGVTYLVLACTPVCTCVCTCAEKYILISAGLWRSSGPRIAFVATWYCALQFCLLWMSAMPCGDQGHDMYCQART